MEDAVLDERWLLGKHCMIKILKPVVHEDILNWGAEVDNFTSRRFVEDQGWGRGS